MKVREVLDRHKFSQIDDNEFERDGWTVRIDYPNFELFTDPEIDTRYFFGSLDNLEKRILLIETKY